MTPTPHNHSTMSAAIALEGPPLDITCTMIDSTTTMLMSSVLPASIDELPLQEEPGKPSHAEPSPTKPEQFKPTLLPHSKLFLSNRTSVNRFTDAQRDRTLRHHKLLQPTSSQEKLHLARLRAERLMDRRSSSSNSLLTLPEEIDESIDEEEIIVYTTTSNTTTSNTTTQDSNTKDQSSSSIVDEVCHNFKCLSTMSHSTVSTASISDSQRSISDEDDSENEDECTPSSPFPNELRTYPICQPCEMESHSSSHRFVVCADTQFGITR